MRWMDAGTSGSNAATENGTTTLLQLLGRRLHADVLEGLLQLLDALIVLAALAELAGVRTQRLGGCRLRSRRVLHDLLVELLLERGALLRWRHRCGKGRCGHEYGGHG